MKRSDSMLTRVEEYLRYRHPLGYALRIEGGMLHNFVRFADQGGDRGPLTCDLAMRWARLPAKADRLYWVRRIEVLIGFADFKGNCQLLSTGNLGINDRVSIFMMDYPHRTRLKLLGNARVLDAREHPELVDQLGPELLRKKVERFFLIQVISYDWNCPQYITPRFTAAEVENFTAPLKARIAELEAQLVARGTPRVASQP